MYIREKVKKYFKLFFIFHLHFSYKTLFIYRAIQKCGFETTTVRIIRNNIDHIPKVPHHRREVVLIYEKDEVDLHR